MQLKDTDTLEKVSLDSIAFRQSLTPVSTLDGLANGEGDCFWIFSDTKTSKADYSIELNKRDGSWIKSTREQRTEPELAITRLKDAVVTPAIVLGWNKVDGGIYTKDGILCPDFRVRTGHQASTKLETERITNARNVSGTHLYMGQLNSVYGHFILETLGRCWALDHITEFDGDFIFQRVRKSDFSENDVYGKLLRASGIDLSRVRIVDKDTRFENLLVPSAGADLGKSIHDAQIKFYRSVLPRLKSQQVKRKNWFSRVRPTRKKKAQSGSKRLYLSRKKLPLGTHKFLNEDAIERTFMRWNFDIVYPEQLTIEEQITLFSDAEIIAAANSSALHNSIFAPKDCSVFMLDGRTGVHGQADWVQVSLCHAYQQPLSILECESALFVDGISRGRLPYLCNLARLEQFLTKACREPGAQHVETGSDGLVENQLVAQILISMGFWLSRKNAFALARQASALAQEIDREADGLTKLTRQIVYRSLRNKSETPPAIKFLPDEESISIERIQAAKFEILGPIAANYVSSS